jgi:hypothetical protein
MRHQTPTMRSHRGVESFDTIFDVNVVVLPIRVADQRACVQSKPCQTPQLPNVD